MQQIFSKLDEEILKKKKIKNMTVIGERTMAPVLVIKQEDNTEIFIKGYDEIFKKSRRINMYIVKQKVESINGKNVYVDVKIKFMWFRKIVCWLFELLHRKHYYFKGEKQQKTLQILGLRTALVERNGQKSRTHFPIKLDIIERWKKFDELDFIVYGMFLVLVIVFIFLLYGK